jgi:Regulator of ribonuclease activity B
MPTPTPRAIGRRSACLLALLATPIVVVACGGGSKGSAPSGESRTTLTSVRATARASDARLLALLRKDGAHLAQPRSTRLYLDFPTHAEAREATPEIPPTYRVEDLGKTGQSDQYVLRVTTVMVISLNAIGRREAALTTIAGHHHGTLDGWEAAPKP